MARDWTSSPDLHLDLDVDAAGGRRCALERALRDAIHEARLAPGSSLPSSRRLAEDLGYARGTVVEAYAQLASEGYLVAQPGGSTRVASGLALASQTSGSPHVSPAAPSWQFDLRPGRLDIGHTFPRHEWMKSVRAVMGSSPDSAFDYGDPRGREELRGALASYLGRARGVVTAPDQIIICQGFGHGLELTSRALADVGAGAVAMEDPCLPAHRHVVQRHGLGVVAVPVDRLGADPVELDVTGVDAVILTPAHQYPTGVTLHPARRAALADRARRTDVVIIEDDYDGEFRYDRQPVGALQGLAPNDTIYIGTTSKTLAPGLRVGWMVVPPRLVDPIVAAMGPQPGGAGPPSLEQLTLADFINRGRLDRHLRRLRTKYRRRRDAVLSGLATLTPSLEPLGIAAGLHVTLPFSGTHFREDAIKSVARQRQLQLAFLKSHYHHQGQSHSGLVIGFAGPTEPQLPTAIRLLVRVLQESLQ